MHYNENVWQTQASWICIPYFLFLLDKVINSLGKKNFIDIHPKKPIVYEICIKKGIYSFNYTCRREVVENMSEL